MEKIIYILLLLLTLPSHFIQAQTPQRIHNLKSLTDSSGTVHLFYRIYAEYEGTDYFTDNIYHYNTETAEEELFLEDFYDQRYGFVSDYYISDYDFFENNPNKYIYIGGYDSEVGYIQRYDTLAFEGFLTFPYKLFVTGGDSSMVYVSLDYVRIKSFDGGISWPSPRQINEENIPDSSKLNFPLTSLSPYDDSLMFGAFTHFFQSSDAGESYDTVEVYPNNEEVFYDKDGEHVYAINTENCSSNSGCSYYLYKSRQKGVRGSWDKPQLFTTPKNISVHPSVSGELYIWGQDSIFVSEDFGESVNFLYEIEEEITGVAVEGEQIFIATISTLYELENDELILLREIPVSIEEREFEIPAQITLHQNYPNPFNPSTTITFSLPDKAAVSLIIYDMLGRKVATLVDGELPGGEQSFRFDASNLANGMYLYELRTANQVIVKKMTLIK